MCAFCHRGVAPLAVPSVSTHCHVSFTTFSACDSIHKHPCSTLVMCTRMFAICPPLSCYPQHSALLRGLDHTFGLSLLLWALSFPTVPNLCCQDKLLSLTASNAPNPKGIAGVRSSTIRYIWIIHMVVANLSVKHGNETITHLYPLLN